VKPKKQPKKEAGRYAVKVENAGTPMQRLDLTKVVKIPAPIKVRISSAPVTGNSSFTSGGGGTTSIPDYAQARWTADFLPTLYSKLGAVEGNNPWDLPGGDVQWIQEVYDRVYPNSGYKITLGCPVFAKVRSSPIFSANANLGFPYRLRIASMTSALISAGAAIQSWTRSSTRKASLAMPKKLRSTRSTRCAMMVRASGELLLHPMQSEASLVIL
jgi:hypothetical protein